MDPFWQAVFFALALICLGALAILDGFQAAVVTNRSWLLPLGIALFVFPFFWTAVKAA